MTVGDTVSLLPRDLGPGTSTSQASAALATAVGHHLDLGAADRQRGRPGGTGERATQLGGQLVHRHRRRTAAAAPTAAVSLPRPPKAADSSRTAEPTVSFDDLKGCHVQAGKLTEWLKLSLDEPQLLETLKATAQLGVLVSGPARRRQGDDGADGLRPAPARRTRRPRDRRAGRPGQVADGRRRGGDRPGRRRRVADQRHRRAAADHARTRRDADPGRAAHGGGHPRRRVRRHLRGARRARCPAARTGSVRPRTRTHPARRHHPQAAARGAAAQRAGRRSSISTKSPGAHRDSSSPICRRWFARRRCGRRRGPAPTASRPP